MSYPPPSGGFPMYGPPPVPGGGSQYPAPGGPPLGFDSYASQPSYVGATPGVSVIVLICLAIKSSLFRL